MPWFFNHFVFSIEVKDLDCKLCKCLIGLHDCLILLQENSLKEWSYNYAITIETYDDYDPIPVPFNIIYSIAELLTLVKKKEKRQVLLNIYRNRGSPWVKITNLVNTLNIPWCSQLKSFSRFSVALSNWEYFYFSLYWVIVHGRVTPATKFAGTHLCCWVKSDTTGVKCLNESEMWSSQ